MLSRRLVMTLPWAAAWPAQAHHGWSSFDQTRPLYLEGQALTARWASVSPLAVSVAPHCAHCQCGLAGCAAPQAAQFSAVAWLAARCTGWSCVADSGSRAAASRATSTSAGAQPHQLQCASPWPMAPPQLTQFNLPSRCSARARSAEPMARSSPFSAMNWPKVCHAPCPAAHSNCRLGPQRVRLWTVFNGPWQRGQGWLGRTVSCGRLCKRAISPTNCNKPVPVKRAASMWSNQTRWHGPHRSISTRRP